MTAALSLPSRGSEIRTGLAWARAVTARGSRSFYFASWALDPPRRAAAYALYAFLRGADDAADAADASHRERRLTQARGELERAFAGVPACAGEAALQWAIETFGLPREPLNELLQALSGDLGRVRLGTWADLERYCHGVASTVGLAMAPILGAPPEATEAAAALGRAMQLTNILRDVREDYANLDRIYLPAEALEAYGVRETDLGEPAAPPALKRLAAEVGRRARLDYLRSEAGLLAIGPVRSRLTVRLMRAAYGEILARIEAGGFDVLGARVVVSSGRKVALLARILIGADPFAAKPSNPSMRQGIPATASAPQPKR